MLTVANSLNSYKSVSCPSCGASSNHPNAVVQPRCPKCGNVFVSTATAASPPNDGVNRGANSSGISTTSIVAIVVGGLVSLLLFVVVGMFSVFSFRSESESKQVIESVDRIEHSSLESEASQPETPTVTFREVRLPEETRKRLYNDYRGVARTTIEKPLPLPQGSPPRAALEQMLQQTFDRELNRFSALYNVSLDDVKEVIKEGDAKRWDPSPRSNATRNGKRLYPEEMSEGWKPPAGIR